MENTLVLGLGSNLGDRLSNLRSAVQLLQKSRAFTRIKISPLYHSSTLLSPSGPVDANQPFLNAALACQSLLQPVEILALLKRIEQKMGRQEGYKWAPRIIDIDILAWGDRVVERDGLQIPHPGLGYRPFALWPLLDLLPDWQHPQFDLSELLPRWGSRFSGSDAPCQTKRLPYRLLGSRLVGVLNLTPDSFSDGNQFMAVEQAVIHAKKLVLAGAEVIDIGAESTRPNANPVSPHEEWERLAPTLMALEELSQAWPIKPLVSLDTRHPTVAEQAMKQVDIDWINDVSGFEDDRMCRLALEYPVKCVLVHNLGVPADRSKVLSPYPDSCTQIIRWAEQRLHQLKLRGIARERCIFDVGIGFGKTAQQSTFLIKHIKRFQRLSCPLLVGHSRKSFLGLVTDRPYADRDLETAVLSYHLQQQGVEYLRVHNIEQSMRALECARVLETMA